MIAAGYEDSNDADKLRRDPRCMLALERAPETETAQCSLPTISRIEDMADTHTLFWMGHEMVRVYCASLKKVRSQTVLDIDDTLDTVHGHQQLRLCKPTVTNTVSNPYWSLAMGASGGFRSQGQSAGSEAGAGLHYCWAQKESPKLSAGYWTLARPL